VATAAALRSRAVRSQAITGDRSNSYHGDITASPPHWVRLTREGNTITAYHSADGVDWELFTDTSPDGAQTNPIDVEMADPVLVGLFVTSHAAGEIRTYTFDNVSVEGDVGDLVSEDIDSVSGNSGEPIYVAIEDSAGAVAMVTQTAAAKLSVGVGDGEPGGAGEVTLSNILVVEPAGPADIIWVSGTFDDNGDGAPDDQEWVDILKAEGYSVDYNGTYWRTLDDGKIAALNAAKLIIVSRNSNSGDYDDDDEIAQWNAITTPIINCSTHVVRSSRWKWFDSTTILSLTPAVMDVLVCDDPLCEGVPLQISGIDAAVGTSSFMDSGPGNGKVLATGDGLPWIVEWEAGVEFYDGAGEIAGGPRMFFVAGTQEDAATGVGRGEVNLTPGALAIFLNAVAKMIPPSDITVPGDKVLGIPRGLPCGGNPSANYSPCGELPPLVIDDNVSTKYLNFGGNFDAGEEPSGFQVTPYNGASIVTGMTFTTANDAEPRDPVAFELYGSNVSINGPYELIAGGEIVDFNQADAWPRFTMNETPIMFDNDVAYAHYQVLFTAIRDAASANSMQIAEVELLGKLVP